MTPHSQTPTQLTEGLQTDPETGLSEREARERLAAHGPNQLEAEKEKNLFLKFLDQLKDVMILILLAAAAVSFAVSIYNRDPGEFLEPILILVIVILNAVMGMMQESRAEKALGALQELSSPKARVTRDGVERVIEAKDLVPGDVIYLEAGDYVPADARLIKASALKTDESSLTGESLPAEKDALAQIAEDTPLGDRLNMIYSGSAVSYGTGRAIVTVTGMDTEIGKIAGLLKNEKAGQTPLQARLARLGTFLGIGALVACAVIFVIGLLGGMGILEIFMVAVSLAVSAIPEGLPAIVTVVLSIGVQRLAARNAIVRRLPAVETLGGASVICSDKTGTLTKNRMTVTRLWPAVWDEERPYQENDDTPETKALLRLGSLCCDGNVLFEEDGTETHVGDPTETALVKAAHLMGMPRDALRAETPRIMELPFDSDRKLMTVVLDTGNGGYLSVTKGAFDVIQGRCASGDFDKAAAVNEGLGRQGLRVLAVAMKTLTARTAPGTEAELESDLALVGLIGMIDPPRTEVKDAVALCRKAGIRPVMITGDHVVTATAIAKELGIYSEGDLTISGTELAAMGDGDLAREIDRIAVYARVTPQDKIRIVKAWQSRDAIVSMTGDGVNDAPALKAADIGCAMGITGTDVARGAADMVLADDNFATIVAAVREGRGIYGNIRRVVAFLLGTNIGELLTVFFAMLFWRLSPLISIQLLWINLVTDSLPAIALGMEAVSGDVMNRPPHAKKEGIFAGGLAVRVILQGVMFAVLTLFAFQIGLWHGELAEGRTMAFAVLSMTQIFHAFSMRSEKSLFKIGFTTNRTLLWAALISLALILLLLFIPPLASMFGMAMLSAWMYASALGLALVPVLVMEICKATGLIK